MYKASAVEQDVMGTIGSGVFPRIQKFLKMTSKIDRVTFWVLSQPNTSSANESCVTPHRI